jgi:hypothetical protein
MNRHEKAFFIVLSCAPAYLAGCEVHAYSGPPPGDPPAVGQPNAGSPPPHWEKLQNIEGANYMIHSGLNQNMCLDASGDKPQAGTRVELYGCHGRENQRWAFQNRSQNAVSIVGIGLLCIDVVGAQTADGTPVELFGCGQQKNQGFRHFEDGRIRELQTGKCLTVASGAAGTPLTIARCDWNNAGQVWSFSQ